MQEKKQKPLVILTGPTAVGKTALSIGLAKAINGEIISADSMQVYRHMDIGTAKITKEEMQGVTHHLIDILEPNEAFSVSDFQTLAKQAMESIWSKGKIPIIVGGTGFYIQSVLYDISFEQADADQTYRQQLQQIVDTEGAEVLHSQLESLDPQSAKEIHPNNVKRVIRALEYYHLTGKKISEHNQAERQKVSPYRFCYFVLSLPREVLYPRINARVDLMREQGLTEEVQRLLEQGCTGEMVAMQGLGYKEIIAALAGEYSLDAAYDKIKQETRHFAKRQFTWFRRERDVLWVEKEKFTGEDAILDYCLEQLKSRGIL